MSEASTGDGRGDRRRQILDAAVEVFARRGHHDTRIQDIADEAGVAYGLVYHYFGTKERLLGIVFDENWAIFADVVDGVAASGRPPEDQVRALVDYVFGALEAYPARMKVILQEYGRLAPTGQALEHPDVRRVLDRLREAFEASARSGRLAPGVAPAVLPVLLLGALQAAIVATLSDPGASEAPAVRASVQAFVRGVHLSPPTPHREV